MTSAARFRRALARHRDLHWNSRHLRARVDVTIDPMPESPPDHQGEYTISELPRPLRKAALRILRHQYLTDSMTAARWPWSDDPAAEAKDKARRAARIRAQVARMEATAARLESATPEEDQP